jgi:fibronectin-binding autotransporter adhesin
MPIDRISLRTFCVASAASLLLAAGGPWAGQAEAQVTWINMTPGGQLWTTGSFWSTGTAPNAVGAWASVTANITGNQVISLDVTGTLGRLDLGDSDGSAAYTISSVATNRLVFDVASGQASLNQTSSSAANTITAGVRLNDTLVVTNSSANALEISGAIIGSGGLTKSGVGALILGGGNSYTGATTITAGTLQVTRNDALPSSALTMSGGALDLTGVSASAGAFSASAGVSLTGGSLTATSYAFSNAADTATVSSILAGSGGLTKTGAGNLTLNAANTYTGATTVSGGGTLTLGVANAIASTGTLTMTNGALVLGGTQSIAQFNATDVTLGAGTISASTGFTFSVGSGTNTVATVLAGSGTFAKSGNGTLLLTGSNTLSGTHTINAGTLAIGSANRIADGASVTLAGGTFDLGSFTETITNFNATGAGTITGGTLNTSGSFGFSNGSGTVTVDTVLAGSGRTLTKSGNGTLLLKAANTYTGATTVSGGTLALGASERIADGSSLTLSGGSLDLDGATETVANFTASSAGTVTAGTLAVTGTFGVSNASATVQIDAALAGAGRSLTKSGAGTLLLNGINTYTGTTSLTAGTLQLGRSDALDDASSLALSGGTLNLGGFIDTVATFSATGGTVNNGTLTSTGGYSVTNGSGTVQIDAILAGSSNLTKSGAGTLILGGANTYTGTTSIQGGTLQLGSTGNLASTSTVDLVGGTFNLNSRSQTLGSFSINGSGTVTVGTLSAGSYTVNATAASAINAAMTGNGALVKSGAGVLTLGGSNSFTGGTTIDNGGLTVGTGGVLGGAVTLNAGTLTNSVVNGITGNVTVNSGTFTGTSATSLGVLTVAGGAVTNSGAITATQVDVTAVSGTTTFSAPLAAATGAFTRTGAGTLVMSTAQTNYSGTVSLGSSGLVQVGANTTLGTGLLKLEGARLSANSTTARTFGNTLIEISADMTFGDASNNGGLTFASGTGTLIGDRTLTLDSSVNFTRLSGTGGLTKAGNGTLTLSGSNGFGSTTIDAGGITVSTGTLTGPITLNAGTLTNSTANGITGAVTINGGTFTSSQAIGNMGILTLNGGAVSNVAAGVITATQVDVIAASGTTSFSAPLSGSTGAFTRTGAGTLVMGGTMASYTGTVSLGSSGAVQVASASASVFGTGLLNLEGNQLSSNGTTARSVGNNFVQFTGDSTLGDAENTGLLTFTGTAVTLVGDRTLAFASDATFTRGLSGTGTFTKTGAGTLTVNGTSSFGGGGTVSEGTLAVSGANTRLNGSIAVGGSGTLLNSTTSGVRGDITLNAGGVFNNTVTNTATSLSVNGGTFSGSGNTTLTTLTLAGSGDLVNTGTLTASAINATATSGTTVLATTLAGTGSFTKTGAGLVDVTGTNSGYTGPVSLSAGTTLVGRTSALGTGTLSLGGATGVTTLATSGSLASTLSNSRVNFTGTTTFGSGTNNGSLTLSGSGVLTGNATLDVDTGVTLTGALSGSANLTKTGGSTLTLNGANTYVGDTNVSAGQLRIEAAAGAGKTGTTNVQGGSLVLGNNTALGNDALVLSSGGLYGNGNRSIANAVTLSGSIAAGSTGSGVNGSLTFTGPFELAGAGNRFISAGSAITFSGPVSGAGTLVKQGGSSLTLSGSNTFSGGATISDGLLTFSTAEALPATGNVAISGGALAATGSFANVTAWLGSGRIAANPNGALAITANSTSEAIDFSAAANPTLNTASLSLGSVTTLTYSGAFTPYESNGTQTYRLGGGQGVLTFATAITDGGTNPTQVVIRGDGGGGRVRFGTENTFTGNVTLASSYLDFSNPNQLTNVTGASGNALVFQGGGLFYSGTNSDLSGKFAPVESGRQALIHTNGQNVTFATAITGSGGLWKTWAGTLTATADYLGATTVNGGTLNLTLASDAASAPTGTFSMSNNGLLQLTTATNRTVNATFSQSGGGILELSSVGDAALTLSGTITRTSGTTNLPGPLKATGGTIVFNGRSTTPSATDWTVTGATLVLSSTTANQNDTTESVAAGSTVRLGASNQILTAVEGLSGTFDLAGYSDTFETVSGTGLVTNSNSLAPSTLTLTTGGTLTPTFTDSGSVGSLRLVLSGSDASQMFTMANNSNSYVGGTEITQGVLAIGSGANVLGGVAGSLTAAGTALTGSTGTVVIQSTDSGSRTYGGEFRVAGPVTLGGGSTGSLEFAGATTLLTTSTIANDGDVTLSGPVGGANGFTKTGAGLLTLSGNNTYSGPTTLASGTLLAAGSNSGSGGTTLEAGQLLVGGNDPLASGTLSFAGGAVSSDGLSGRTLSNPLLFAASTTLGDSSRSGGLTFTGIGTGTGMQSLTVASDVTLAGALSGDLGLTKAGAASLTLSNAANSFTGGVAITAGEVRVGANAALGTGTLTLTAGSISSDGLTARTLANTVTIGGNVGIGDAVDTGLLTFSGPATLTANSTVSFLSDAVFSGNIGNNGTSRTLTKDGAGTLTLTGSNSHGGTTLNTGRIRLGSNFALGSGTTGTVTLNAGTLSSDGSTAHTIANPVTLGGDVTIGNAIENGALSFTGTSTLTAARTVTFASDATMNVIAGSHLFTKDGPGTLTITGAGTQAGTTINAGTVRIGNAASLGNAGNVTLAQGVTLTGIGTTALTVARPFVLAGDATLGATTGDTAALTFSGTTSFAGNLTLTTLSNVTISGTISGGANTLTKTGSGTLVLSASNAYGNTVVSQGTLRVNNDNALGTTGSVTLASGVTLTGLSTTARTIARPLVFEGDVTLGASATDTAALTFTGASTLTGNRTLTALSSVTLTSVTGEGFDLTKAGTSSLTLVGSGNFGNTNVNVGTLRLGSDTALGTSGTLSLANGTTLTGTGTVARSIANAVTIQSGSVTLGNATDTATLALNGTTTLVASSTVGIASAVTMGPVAGSGLTLTKGGASVLTMSGANDVAGVVLAAGRLRIGNDAAIGPGALLTLTSGTLSSDGVAPRSVGGNVLLNGNVTLGDTTDTAALILAGTTTLDGNRTIAALSDVTIDLLQQSGGTRNLIKNGAGTLTLTGSNAYGNTNVNAGRLRLGNDFALGTAGTLTLTTGGILSGTGSEARTIANAVSLTGLMTYGDATDNGSLTFTGATTMTASSTASFVSDVTMNRLAGSHAFTKLAAGTLTFTGSNAQINTVLSAGRIRAGNDFAFGATGTISFAGGVLSGTGSAARTFANAVTLNGASTLGDTVDDGLMTFSGTSTLLSNSTLTLLSDVNVGRITQAAGSTFSLTKAGTATLTLTAASSYSGGTTLTDGRLRLDADDALGTAGTVTLAGGRLSSASATARELVNPVAFNGNVVLGDTIETGALTFSNGVNVLGDSTVTLVSDVSMAAVSGLTLTKAGAATLTLTTANAQAGTTLTAGRIRMGADGALGSSAALNGGILSSTGTAARAIASPWSLGGSVAIGDATENGAFTFTGSGTLTANAALNAVTNVTIASLAEAGGARSLAKNGVGLVTFTGVSTFSGPLDINTGTVFVQSGASLAAAVDINSGATLAGSGAVGTITVGAGGTITPGNSPGAITGNNGIFEASGNYNWQLLDVSGTAGNVNGWDLIQIASGGTLDLSGLSSSSTFNLNLWTLSATGPDVNGAPANFVANTMYVFPIVRFDSLSSLVLPGGFGQATAGRDLTSLFTINLTGTNGTGGWSGGSPPPASDISVRVGASGTSLDIIVVPEPATLVLVGIGAAFAAVARLRRRV